jgi:hypothetical protein
MASRRAGDELPMVEQPGVVQWAFGASADEVNLDARRWAEGGRQAISLGRIVLESTPGGVIEDMEHPAADETVSKASPSGWRCRPGTPWSGGKVGGSNRLAPVVRPGLSGHPGCPRSCEHERRYEGP